MKDIYSIGEQEPWRLSKDSAQKLLLAICRTNAEIVSASIDTTCPPIHACIRVRMDANKIQIFQDTFGHSLDAVEVACGQKG